MKRPPGADATRDLYSTAADAVLRGGAAGDPSGGGYAMLAKMPDFPFEYHCKRFVMGFIREESDEGEKLSIPTSDDDELRKVMQLQWDKKGFIYKRLETFLQDGTVVIWVEWGVPKAATPLERPPHARSVAELLDPRVPPASAGAIPPEAKEKPGVTGQGVDAMSPLGGEDVPVGGDGPSFEDEDWSHEAVSSVDSSDDSSPAE